MADVIRRIDDLGRIVIPKAIRQEIGFNEGDAIKITITKDGKVLLSKCEETEEGYIKP